MADVFVDDRSVEEMLKADGYAKLGLANGVWLVANGQPETVRADSWIDCRIRSLSREVA